MYLTAYRFDGDSATLAEAHDAMAAQFPTDALDLHVCIKTATGILVLDGCPTAEDAIAFQQSPEFAAALADAGLPNPRIESLGEIWSSVGVS